MTAVGCEPAVATPPDLVWPAAVSAEAAVRTVARRLPPGAELSARLYHHPFLGMMFLSGTESHRSSWRRSSPRSVLGTC